MSVFVAAIATESGVPLFTRKRGACEGIQFSTTASLYGVNMYSKCHDVTFLNTQMPNGSVLWKEFCKSVTLLGVVSGGLECELERLLASVHDVMVLTVGRPELEAFKSTEQVKRDLRPGLALIDSLLESLDPSVAGGPQPTMLLDLMECILCPEGAQLQRILDQYCEQVSGRYACLSVHARLAATSSDWSALDAREARLLLLMTSQPGAPLRETCVYLPYASPDVAFRAVTCKLLSDVFVLVMCGATPPLSQVDAAVLRCWQHSAPLLRDTERLYPRNIPDAPQLDLVRGILIVNIASRRCVFSQTHAGHKSRSWAHRLDTLRTFYVRAARALAPELCDDAQDDCGGGAVETYLASAHHTCHARRAGALLGCVLYTDGVATHAARMLTTQILTAVSSNKDIEW